MPSFTDDMAARLPKGPKIPVWQGPCGQGRNGGVTFSLLSRFICCRERFRLHAIEGLRPADGFNHRIEYGHMWHVCEEAAASEREFGQGELSGLDTTAWEDSLKAYAQSLGKRYPLSQEQIDHWYNVCKVQFPLYVKYWASHEDMTRRTPLLQEQVFDVPYTLPSGRVVRLRGKWDSVDLVGTGANQGIWLQENKSKGDVNEGQLRRQLSFDLQTMLYMVALLTAKESPNIVNRGALVNKHPIKGVRYNVIRRPLSGGKGSIVRHKPSKSNPAGESKESYYGRLRTIIEENPGEFFYRWNVDVRDQDVAKFRRECLDPMLESLCRWYDHVAWCVESKQDPFDTKGSGGIHWRHPFGVFNVLDDGGSSDLDSFLETGNEVGLRRNDRLFPELE